MALEKVNYLKSDELAFRHGFFESDVGFSKGGKFSGLNMTTRTGDDKTAVQANRALALKQLNFKPSQLAFLDQLEHGSRVLDATSAAGGMDFDGYDTIMTADSSIVIGLGVADCLPVILASEADGVIAIAHAGWRGLHDQVLAKAVVAMSEAHSVDPANIVAVIGPGISLESFEFGKEAKDLFGDRYVQEIDNKPHVDLLLMAEDQLAEAGVAKIDNLKVDTFTNKKFFSFRRDGQNTGRFLAVASL